jgi:hypothetical protein
MIQDLIRQLQLVLSDPTAEPQVTAVIAAVFLLVLLAVVLVLLIVLPPAEENEADPLDASDEPPLRARRRSYLAGLIPLVLLAAVLGGLVYGNRFVTSTSFCLDRCHALDAAAAAWAGAEHSDVDCIACHRSPGPLGLLDTRLRGVGNLVSNVSSTEVSGTAVSTESACRECHSAQLEQVLTIDNLRISHRDFIDSMPCRDCHGRVGHGRQGRPAGSGQPLGIGMSLCRSCHDGITAASDCGTCHADGVVYSSRKTSAPRVELSAPRTCEGCHSLEGCTACHGLEMPHPEGWAGPAVHAPLGAFARGDQCKPCHGESCLECHSPSLHTNHGPDWVILHRAPAGGTGCTNCHDPEKVGEDMCALCH